jgi:signal transduction histidine kinase
LKAKNIEVKRLFGKCPPVIGVPGELRQAIANLVSNAVDAVPENGNITVALHCVREAGFDEVQVLIEDDGPGIAEEHMQRIFEPFFTTKRDIGTGLGLYVAREILERHGGTVTVRPRPEGSPADTAKLGACFILRLPCDPDPHAQESVVSHA